MKQNSAYILLLIVLVLVSGALRTLESGLDRDKQGNLPSPPPSEHTSDTSELENFTPTTKEQGTQHKRQSGFAIDLGDQSRLHNLWIEKSLQDVTPDKRYMSYYFNNRRGEKLTYSATGINKRPYIVNSFLLGYKPFDTDRIWVPLATLSQRKSYLLDHKLYGPNMWDVWQNSEQAYRYSRGDCEDHALLLADWLIELGYDARVVIGEVKDQGGHAWVWMDYKGTQYVLESTDKRRIRSINNFIDVRRATEYLPVAMFNREFFWENTGSKFTTRYTGPHWKLRSRFERGFTD